MIETHTGHATVHRERYSNDIMLVWAVDGYALIPRKQTTDNGEPAVIRAFDFDCNEFDSQIERYVPQTPGYWDGVFYPHEEFGNFQNLVVDDSGNFVSYWDTTGEVDDWIPVWGAEFEPRPGLRWPVAVAADGNAAVFTHDDGNIHLVNLTGSTLEVLDARATGIRVYDGLLVEVYSGNGGKEGPVDRVLLPRSE